MTNEQLLLVIGVPILANGIAITILAVTLSSRITGVETSLNKRIDDLAHNVDKRIDDLARHVDRRFDDLHAFLRVVMGKLDELDHRVTNLEQN